LAGDAIPLFAAIITIADAYDAMTSNRPYRKAMRKEEALREIERQSGAQFRPDLARVFLELMQKGRDQHAPLYVVRAAG
jgi:HD-GYP domain-containing protein (c-di-GMP phosphodiesterase class II)